MNVADEGTSAHLKAIVQDCPTVGAMNEQAVVQSINQVFKHWGLPKQIKIDNGHPFVTPNHRDIPTKSKLWWIGLGIEVIQNQLRQPQQNGIVECLQGIMKNWSNTKAQKSIRGLQKRLDLESDFQRNHYRIPAKGNKTRIELHSSLEQNPRKYDPRKFDMNRVYDYLTEQVWERTLNNNGSTHIFGQTIYISYKLKKQPVTVTFDPIDKQWLIRSQNGTILKTSTKGVPNEKQIKDFTMISKN